MCCVMPLSKQRQKKKIIQEQRKKIQEQKRKNLKKSKNIDLIRLKENCSFNRKKKKKLKQDDERVQVAATLTKESHQLQDIGS